jgi:hypothetical protein
MPLIERAPVGRSTKLSVQIDAERRKRLESYCRFSQNKPERVVLGALDLLFRQDREFQEWEARAAAEPGPGELAAEGAAKARPNGRAETAAS